MTQNDTFAGVEALIIFIAVIMIVALFVGFFLPDSAQQVQARIVGSQAESTSSNAMNLLSVSGSVSDATLSRVEVAVGVNRVETLESSSIQVIAGEQAFQYQYAGQVEDCGAASLSGSNFYVAPLGVVISGQEQVELCFLSPQGIDLGSEMAVDIIPQRSPAIGVDLTVPQFALNDIVFMYPADE